jgi:Arc/MetJ-type ribon-helix-helix transcriptional regulator
VLSRGAFALFARRKNPRTMKAMEVQLTPDQMAFARQAIVSGRLHAEADAVHEVLALWEEREGTRAEILAAADRSEAV